MEVTIEQVLEKGIEAQQAGRFQEADELYSRILKEQPKHPHANHNMGLLFVSLGEVEKALAFLKIALDANPNVPQFWLTYIVALIKLERIADAKDYFEQAESKGVTGDGFDILAQRLQHISANAQEQPKSEDPPQDQLKSLIKLYTQAQFQQAITQALQLLLQFPNSFSVYNILGASNNGLGRLEAAVEAYKNALSIKPEYAEAYNNMGAALQSQGELEDAKQAYERALSINPHYAEAYNNLGAALRDQGKLEEAIEAYGKAVFIKPDYAEAYKNLGAVLKDQGNFEEAVDAYNRALAVKPDYEEAKTDFAILLFESKNYENAAKLFATSDTIQSQSYLLKCFYELEEPTKFYNHLDYLLARGANSCVIGSFISRSEIRYGLSRDNPFCKEPLKYVLKTDLSMKYDFKRIFVDGALDILNENIVQNKSQGHLTNGVQTSGNIFSQVGSLTNEMQEIIHSELRTYRDHFKGSTEGFIKNWPNDYTIYGWLVSMKSGGALAPHIHDQGWITGSIYINVPEKSTSESGNLVVSINDTKNSRTEMIDRMSLDVVTGSLCLFPSSLLHYTVPFKAKENRVVLAFDMRPKI